MNDMNYVIIGNSAAAAGCIEGIRSVDTECGITVISDEPYHIYSRPLISYLLCGRTDRERMKYRPDDYYSVNNVKTMLGQKVTAIDAAAKTVALSDGGALLYDRLFYSAGSHPFIPPMEGLESTGYHTFMSLDDALSLEKELGRDKRMLIIGAGLIGLKCAEGVFDKVGSIDIVDLADRVLPSILDTRGSDIVMQGLCAKGIRFHLSQSVKRFSQGTAYLSGSDEIPFDILVVASGVRPNTSLIAQAGGAVRRGVVTDSHCLTSLSGVYAGGDCAESRDITTDTDKIIAIMPNAYIQGYTAGRNMAGDTQCDFCKAVPMNSIGFFGCHIITAGAYDGEDRVMTDNGRNYKRLFVKDGRLKGYILIGNVERAGIYTALIRDKTPLDTVDFSLISEKPQLMAFSRRERSAVLSGGKN